MHQDQITKKFKLHFSIQLSLKFFLCIQASTVRSNLYQVEFLFYSLLIYLRHVTYNTAVSNLYLGKQNDLLGNQI